ncbi:hypothetical protein AYK24_07345 [Thermoplasmatales archaeon SG8-52-4]|nr:MAG: hypothetical protein AYK24_07345 [Thermoplasmatales archaeon SG8-52-4]
MKKIIVLALVLTYCLVIVQAKADFVFGEPENLGPTINTPKHDWDQSVSLDGLSIGFARSELNWSGYQMWVTDRPTVSDPWSDPVFLGEMNDYGAILKDLFDSKGFFLGTCTLDGLEAYVWEDFPGGYGGQDIWVIKRDTVEADFGPPENIGQAVNSSSNDYGYLISPDGLALYFPSDRPEGYGRTDLYVTTRAKREDPWGIAVNLGAHINSPDTDYNPHVTYDGLLLLFVSNRPGGFGAKDIWMTRRASITDPWEQAVNLGPMVNTSVDDDVPFISPDGSILYFSSSRPGGYGGEDLWYVPIIPIVDLNGDGIVDAADMCIIVDNWGTDNQLCDIGPMPWGDGIVDVEDLIVIAGHLFEETTPVE